MRGRWRLHRMFARDNTLWQGARVRVDKVDALFSKPCSSCLDGCIRCGLPAERHVSKKCLFEPTLYKSALDYLVENDDAKALLETGIRLRTHRHLQDGQVVVGFYVAIPFDDRFKVFEVYEATSVLLFSAVVKRINKIKG